MLISNNFNNASDDVDGDEPIWVVCGDDDMMSSSREHDDDITRACCINILLNTASLVDLPRWDKLTTWMGHETEKENERGQTGTLRGNGGKIERVVLNEDDDDDVVVDVDVDVDVLLCVLCCDVLYIVLLLSFVFEIGLLFDIFVLWFNIGGNDGIEDGVVCDVCLGDKEDTVWVWDEDMTYKYG